MHPTKEQSKERELLQEFDPPSKAATALTPSWRAVWDVVWLKWQQKTADCNALPESNATGTRKGSLAPTSRPLLLHLIFLRGGADEGFVAGRLVALKELLQTRG